MLVLDCRAPSTRLLRDHHEIITRLLREYYEITTKKRDFAFSRAPDFKYDKLKNYLQYDTRMPLKSLITKIMMFRTNEHELFHVR